MEPRQLMLHMITLRRRSKIIIVRMLFSESLYEWSSLMNYCFKISVFSSCVTRRTLHLFSRAIWWPALFLTGVWLLLTTQSVSEQNRKVLRTLRDRCFPAVLYNIRRYFIVAGAPTPAKAYLKTQSRRFRLTENRLGFPGFRRRVHGWNCE